MNRPLVLRLYRERGECAVELEITPNGGSTWKVFRYATGATWGACVRKLEEFFMFAEPSIWVGFIAQLLPHEQPERCALRVLAGEPRRDVVLANRRAAGGPLPDLRAQPRDFLRAVLRER